MRALRHAIIVCHLFHKLLSLISRFRSGRAAHAAAEWFDFNFSFIYLFYFTRPIKQKHKSQISYTEYTENRDSSSIASKTVQVVCPTKANIWWFSAQCWIYALSMWIISRIILASFVNASNRRRRGLKTELHCSISCGFVVDFVVQLVVQQIHN